MMTCKEASRLISEGMEHPLGRMERWGLRFHLWICDNCRRFERQVRFLRKLLHMLGDRAETGVPGPNLAPESKDRIRQALLEEG